MQISDRAGRSRKALLWGLGALVVLQLGLTLVMEFWLPQLRDPHFGLKAARLKRRLEREEFRDYDGAKRRPKLVVMVGSSHVADGFRGGLIEDDLARALGEPVIVYNLGIPGDVPLNELVNCERLVRDGMRPDLLLIEVMPSLLTVQAKWQLDSMPAERMGLRERALLRHHHLPVDELSRYTWTCWGAPWFAHRLELLSLTLPRFLPGVLRQDTTRTCDRSGWVTPWYDPSPDNLRRAREFAEGAYRPVLEHFELGGPFCPAFRPLLERCRQEHVATAFVLMPEAETFRALYSPNAWPQIDRFLGELTAAFGTPVINARDWVHDADFFDTHHLLPPGAEVFTRRLGREAILPLLRSQAGRGPWAQAP